MNAYQSFYETYSSVADIYIVYILEAHFVEKDKEGRFIGGWPIGYQYNYEQTKTLEERKKMVKLLLDEYHPTIPIYIDTMENEFQEAYHPWPDKAYVFMNYKLKYIAKGNDNGTRNTYWTTEIAHLLNSV